MYQVEEGVVKTCSSCNVEKSLSCFAIAGRNGYRNRKCKICINNGKQDAAISLDQKRCTACSKIKSLSFFYKKNTMDDGYTARCKSCVLNKRYNPHYPGNPNFVKADPEFDNMFRLFKTTKEEYIRAYKLLEGWGYDLKSTKTIHEQFCEKHNLNPYIRKMPITPHRSIESLKEFLF
jgi:hypothetical protein